MNASYEHKHKIEVTRQEQYYKFYNLIKYKRINNMNKEIIANIISEHKITNLFCTFDSVFWNQSSDIRKCHHYHIKLVIDNEHFSKRTTKTILINI